jgi:hypothetical protein
VFDIRPKSLLEPEGMLLDKDVAKFVKSSSNGKVCGVHVVDTDYELNQEISSIKQNFVQELKLILKLLEGLKR